MATTKISITVDSERLEELRALPKHGVSLSAVIDEALRLELNRLRMLELLREIEAEHPMSVEGRLAGEALCQRTDRPRLRSPYRVAQENEPIRFALEQALMEGRRSASRTPS